MRLQECLLGLTVLAFGALHADSFERGTRNASFVPAFANQFRAPIQDSAITLSTRILADGLDVPWGIATLPEEGGYLITERSGQLRHLGLDGRLSAPLIGVPDVYAHDQGGLLDVAVGPDFLADRLIYLTYAKPLGGRRSATAAARARLSADFDALQDTEDIFVQSPPSRTAKHYGSRLVFDSDGNVFITTGEHSSRAESVLAQDLATTYGKIIRIAPDGTVPDDNPFRDTPGAQPEIWSYGHRNVQGAAFDSHNVLWTIEHGPRGGDELNRPEAGKNYGWPIISYGINYSGSDVGDGIAVADGLEQPVYFWDPVIAPSGMSFLSDGEFPEWEGDLLIGGLASRALVRLDIGDKGEVRGEERLLAGIGRVRDVEVLGDGSFVLLVEGRTGSVVHVTRLR